MKLRALLFSPLLLVACGQPSAPAAPSAPPAPSASAAAPSATAAAPAVDATAEATNIFQTRCTPCHGARGAGDGPASAGLTPKPANFTAAEWQKKVTDEHIEKIILYGGMAVGKSAAMPPNPDLDPKPEVVKALRAHVRSLSAAQ